jgi:cystathionine beta-lyase
MKFNTKTIHRQHITIQVIGCYATRISNNHICTTKSGNLLYHSRTANPTRTALENALASIENEQEDGFSSGLAATDCLMRGEGKQY